VRAPVRPERRHRVGGAVVRDALAGARTERRGTGPRAGAGREAARLDRSAGVHGARRGRRAADPGAVPVVPRVKHRGVSVSRREAILSAGLVLFVALAVRAWAATQIAFPRPEDVAYYVGV